jgi:hypothetical protein
MLFRHGAPTEIAAYVRHHPLASLEFPLQLYSVAPHASLAAFLHHQNRAAVVERTQGHVDAQAAGHLDASCILPLRLTSAAGIASMQQLAARYRTPQTQVLVYVAPVPSCTNLRAMVAIPFATIDAEPGQYLPATSFMDDNNYAHVDPAAVPLVTHLLEIPVAQALHLSAPPAHASTANPVNTR